MDLQSTPIGRSGNLPGARGRIARTARDCRNRRPHPAVPPPRPSRSTEDPHRMADSSFDIVSKIDKQEVANAVNSAAKEIATRYDFKNVGASIELAGEVTRIKANTEERCQGRPRRRPDLARQAQGLAQAPRRARARTAAVGQGVPPRRAASRRASRRRTRRRSARSSATRVPSRVKSQIQGDELRVTSKSRDDLQAVQALLKARPTSTSRSSSPTTADRAGQRRTSAGHVRRTGRPVRADS